MKQIPLTQGKFALVDDDIYDLIGNLKWCLQKGRTVLYATRHSSRKLPEKRHTIWMHHLVIGKPTKGMMIDHIDGNGLNNQRSNLRIVTNRQNLQNMKNHRNGKLSGCYYNKNNNKWQAQIRINGKIKYLGYYNTEQEAHDAYLKALKYIV